MIFKRLICINHRHVDQKLFEVAKLSAARISTRGEYSWPVRPSLVRHMPNSQGPTSVTCQRPAKGLNGRTRIRRRSARQVPNVIQSIIAIITRATTAAAANGCRRSVNRRTMLSMTRRVVRKDVVFVSDLCSCLQSDRVPFVYKRHVLKLNSDV